MIPISKVRDLISKHKSLEKELSSGEIDKKKFAEKSKEYSDLNEIIQEANDYNSFESSKEDLEKILTDKDSDEEMKELAEKARSKKLMPIEYQGGSFSISNLGMFGVDNFDAVINPPHGAILAVGRGLKKPIVNDDESISVANLMSLTLSVDHRVIDGALGAELLRSITKYLEDPILMLT